MGSVPLGPPILLLLLTVPVMPVRLQPLQLEGPHLNWQTPPAPSALPTNLEAQATEPLCLELVSKCTMGTSSLLALSVMWGAA